MKKIITSYIKSKTTLFALLLSFFGSCGLYCLLAYLFSHLDEGGIGMYPILIPCAFVGGVVCFFACIIILGLYVSAIMKTPSWKKIIIDILLVIVTFIPFLMLAGYIEKLLAVIIHFFIK